MTTPTFCSPGLWALRCGDLARCIFSNENRGAGPPPSINLLLTTTITLDSLFSPILIAGVSRLIEPISSGVLSGPAVDGMSAVAATVTVGVANPVFGRR